MPMDTDFKKIFREEFKSYRNKNSHLSLRSFAKRLGLAPSTVHQYLNGRYFPSEKNLMKIAAALNWSNEMVQAFLEKQGGATRKMQIFFVEEAPFPITDLSMKVLSLRSPDLKLTLNEIAERLELSAQEKSELSSLLGILARQKLIQFQNNEVTFNEDFRLVSRSSPSGPYLEFQKKSLHQFMKALAQVSKEDRLVLMGHFRIKNEDMNGLVKEINYFTGRLRQKYEDPKVGELYQFVIGALPLL